MKAIIVHGGAWNIPKELHKGHINGCKKAAENGFEYLNEDALQAVVEAVAYMEDDEIFDAGKGSFLNEEGEVEMDAIVYDGYNGKFGSICSVKHLKNPVRVARNICNEEYFSILVGKGAEKYAQDKGFAIIDNNELIIEREKKRWKELKNKNFIPIDAFSTVGAVALDIYGKIAVANSTGGTPLKKKERVGDTPIPGAGAYATKYAGASATGYGEAILHNFLTKNVCDEIFRGMHPQNACRKCIEEMAKMKGGLGGVISLNRKGEYGFYYNTPYMALAIKTEKESFTKI